MISEEEKKAIKLLKDIENNSWSTKYIMSSDSKNATIILNLIETQNKMIELMAEFIWEYDCCEHFKNEDENFKCEGWFINRECRENCIKEYFRNKAKESENE